MLHIESIAIIGAGPSGLATAKYLLAEKKFSKVQVFEQRSSAGGIWNYTNISVVDSDFTIPRPEPTLRNDTPIWTEGEKFAQFVSPVYDLLETNIPHSLMNYSDSPFPGKTSLFPVHSAVLSYLQQYAADLQPNISFSTQILDARKVVHEDKSRWQITSLDLSSHVQSVALFDALVVASGHYNDPYIPVIPGLDDFARAHPGSVSHSKFYRNPAQFNNKKVVVVGNSASGIDVSAQIATVSKHPLFISEKSASNSTEEDREWAKQEPEIARFEPLNRTVIFSNGDSESDVDAVVFCTGYFYSYPFLSAMSETPTSPITLHGTHVANLYEDIIYSHDVTLAFIGIPQRVVPFPIAEAQSAWVARIWAGRLPVPSKETMQAWLDKRVFEVGSGRALHTFGYPIDVAYINRLHAWSLEATPRPGLENNGAGKEPPFWDDEKAWVRKSFPEIKAASRKLGDKRGEVTSLHELGFDYESWKASQ